MAYTTKVAEYLHDGGATNDEMDDLIYFCRTFKDGEKKTHYKVHRLLARFLRHSWTPYKKHGRFDFRSNWKQFLLGGTKREVVDDDPPSNAIYVGSESFVKIVVRLLDKALQLRTLWPHFTLLKVEKFILTP